MIKHRKGNWDLGVAYAVAKLKGEPSYYLWGKKYTVGPTCPGNSDQTQAITDKIMGRPMYNVRVGDPRRNLFLPNSCSCSNPACNLPNGFNCRNPI